MSVGLRPPPSTPRRGRPQDEVPADGSALLAEVRQMLEAMELRLAGRLEQMAQHGGRDVRPLSQCVPSCAWCERLEDAARGREAPKEKPKAAEATCEDPHLDSRLSVKPGPKSYTLSSSVSLASDAIGKRLERSTYTSEDMARRMSARLAAGATSATLAATNEDFGQGKAEAMSFSPRMEAVSAIFILLSSLSVGLEAEYSARNRGEPRAMAFFWIDCIFTFIFLVEFVMRICTIKGRFVRRDNIMWGCFDTVLVCSSIVDVWIEALMLLNAAGSAGVGDVSQIRLIRVLRITRAVRTLRVTRLIRFIASLRILVASIVATLQSLVWAMLLLMIIVYAAGVVFTQATTEYLAVVGSDPIAEKFWGNLPLAMFTLFKCISNGLSWHDAVEPLHRISIGLVAVFSVFIAFTTFAVLNVLTGVFCQSAIDAVHRDPDLVAQSVLEKKQGNLSHLERLFDVMDTKRDGHITFPQFERIFSKSADMQAYFEALGVRTDDAWEVFKLIDADCSHGMDRQEFVSGMLRLQGTASSVDIQTVLDSQKWISDRLSTVGSKRSLDRQDH